MKNKEQLLYFFLQGKISLSQYDYKFMANLQTMIQNQNRVTSNQADLFDKLISKYSKQLSKNGFIKEELKALPWKTMVVESTSEYTGAVVSLLDNKLTIRVPFNKTFISEFRTIKNNSFEWNKELKLYSSEFGTNALKIAYTALPKFFSTVKYSDELQEILTELEQYNNLVWDPTLVEVNGSYIVAAVNPELAEAIKDIDIALEPETLFKLTSFGINVDSKLYDQNEQLAFAANTVHEIELGDLYSTIEFMKKLGCENVIVGRGIRNLVSYDELAKHIEKCGMKHANSMAFGNLPEGVNMLIQHTSPTDNRSMSVSLLNASSPNSRVSKIIVVKDSRPVEVK